MAAVLAVAAVAGQAAASSPGDCTWVPQVLPLPAGAEQGQVNAGDGDWLVGTAYTHQAEGVLWHDGRLTALGSAFGLDTHLHSINPDGVAVGTVTDAGGYYHAIRYRDGAYEYLPQTAGSSNALDINSRGDIAGYDGAATLIVWQANGSVRTLPLPAGETPYGWPAIDDDGTVAAWTGFFDTDWKFHWRGYVWASDGTRTMLTPVADGDDVDVRDIKNGHVVGSSGPSDGAKVATEWTLTGQVAATHADGTLAVAVNRAGDAVGSGAAGQGLLWVPGQSSTPLPMPAGHQPGLVSAITDHEAGGTSFPQNEFGARPVRWLCQ